MATFRVGEILTYIPTNQRVRVVKVVQANAYERVGGGGLYRVEYIGGKWAGLSFRATGRELAA